MGLDMYLNGEMVFRGLTDEQLGTHPVQFTYRLGRWWQHAALHEYIVKAFADGVDDCQEIYLTDENLRQIVQAIRAKALPKLSGGHFGRGRKAAEQRAEAIGTFERAIEWMNREDDTAWRSVIYRASW